LFQVKIRWSKANALAAMRQLQFVTKDQEEKNVRDMKVDIVIAPLSEGPFDKVVIQVVGLWTGIDSGLMSSELHKAYLQPFLDLPHDGIPVDLFASLSLAGRLVVDTWENGDNRYAVGSFHSDHWWDDEFLQLIAAELQERVNMVPDVFPSFQFLPKGKNTQWARNAGMNALTWRDTRMYVDDWMFVKNESRYGEVVERMRNFRESTRKYWQSTDGGDHSTWMSPSTLEADSTDLRIPSVAKSFFPDQAQFKQLQLLKSELDPVDLFSNKGTIPLPGGMNLVV